MVKKKKKIKMSDVLTGKVKTEWTYKELPKFFNPNYKGMYYRFF